MRQMTFEEQKQVQFEILKFVANFCERNNLRYFLAYGTLIGAVRHKGYIPWDDDIDVVMPRKDYNKLIEIFNQQNDEAPYELISPYDDRSRYAFIRITDNRTIKVGRFLDYTKGALGVDIDIFPLDGQPDCLKKHLSRHKKLKFLERLMLYTVEDRKQRKGYKKLVLFLVQAFFSKIALQKKIDKILSKIDFETSQYIGEDADLYTSAKNRYPRKYVDESVQVEFEGVQFRAPKYYHEVLTTLYGDYMKLPPEEQRIGHHKNQCYWKN